MKGNIIVGQSGGPTAAINASLSGAIQEAIRSKEIDGVYGALNGIQGVLAGTIIDLRSQFSRQEDSRILRKHHREIGKTMAINRVTIMGNLTRDAELRKKGDATSVLTFGLAINEKKKDSETGEYVDAPVFVDCALFGARAEALAPYLTKGKKVSVDGRLRYHSWMKNEEKPFPFS